MKKKKKNLKFSALLDPITKRTAPFFKKVGALSRIQRVGISFATFILIAGSYYYFILQPKQKELTSLKSQLTTLQNRLTVLKSKAATLEKYEKMMEERQAEFNLAIQSLPDRKEIPALLTSVSRSGGDAGLEFLLFQPKNEVVKGFYAEIPVALKVVGGYHQLADFYDLVSRLYRIVNVSDISITMGKGGQGLETSCNAVTYRFLELKEINDARKNAGNKRKKRKKKR